MSDKLLVVGLLDIILHHITFHVSSTDKIIVSAGNLFLRERCILCHVFHYE